MSGLFLCLLCEMQNYRSLCFKYMLRLRRIKSGWNQCLGVHITTATVISVYECKSNILPSLFGCSPGTDKKLRAFLDEKCAEEWLFFFFLTQRYRWKRQRIPQASKPFFKSEIFPDGYRLRTVAVNFTHFTRWC